MLMVSYAETFYSAGSRMWHCSRQASVVALGSEAKLLSSSLWQLTRPQGKRCGLAQEKTVTMAGTLWLLFP